MDGKIVVPEGMLDAAKEAQDEYLLDNQNRGICLEVGLQAALLWLSENPVVPTVEQFNELHEKWNYDEPGQNSSAVEFQRICHAWQRRMFLAPEPEVSGEIKDLLYTGTDTVKDAYFRPDLYNQRIIEAYHRGRRGRRSK